MDTGCATAASLNTGGSGLPKLPAVTDAALDSFSALGVTGDHTLGGVADTGSPTSTGEAWLPSAAVPATPVSRRLGAEAIAICTGSALRGSDVYLGSATADDAGPLFAAAVLIRGFTGASREGTDADRAAWDTLGRNGAVTPLMDAMTVCLLGSATGFAICFGALTGAGLETLAIGIDRAGLLI